MAHNISVVTQQLINLFGKEDFIDKLHLREKYNLGPLKGKVGQKHSLSYHHIKTELEGGHATVENGALLNGYNHALFNEQSSEIQEKLNDEFQKYKLTAMLIGTFRSIEEIKKVELPLQIDDTSETYIVIPLESSNIKTSEISR